MPLLVGSVHWSNYLPLRVRWSFCDADGARYRGCRPGKKVRWCSKKGNNIYDSIPQPFSRAGPVGTVVTTRHTLIHKL